MLGLLVFRRVGKGALGLHEAAHNGCGVRLHQRGKQRFLAGKIAVKGACCHTGLLNDGTQGSGKKIFFQKFFFSAFQNARAGGGFLFQNITSYEITLLYNAVIV